MTPRLFVRKAARADIAEAFRWYEERSRGLGSEFLRVVSLAYRAIERSPEQFPIIEEDIRKVVLRRFPYTIYFVILPRRISVIGVMHARRHPTRWQSRR